MSCFVGADLIEAFALSFFFVLCGRAAGSTRLRYEFLSWQAFHHGTGHKLKRLSTIFISRGFWLRVKYSWLHGQLSVFPAGVESEKPTHFTVFTKGAGKAPLDVQFSAPLKGEAVRDFEIIDNYDYSHTVKYTPVQQVSSHQSLCTCTLTSLDSAQLQGFNCDE